MKFISALFLAVLAITLGEGKVYNGGSNNVEIVAAMSTKSSCVDTLPGDDCQHFSPLCESPNYKPLLEKECPRTCGFCS
uniref:ShKT domain-containing protein n=1 Tax=Rhabditophanes sp. KR3021 TaxID=114890 RepID=A0AC35TGY2_9BILA